ncbi:molybdopterin-synthase adenylyltransferase MoeB [Vibrio navarrensis]|uniref:HesA/MoeB/ThiF family protein n=1 Tax=Vibrio navarrensis TaxID=29495 RepID=A0AAJ4LU78_9VIBR|nr:MULTISPECIES: HesA/MoeB/ThiF family protein [Vibrio]KJR37587.1 molybdopterin-synthase adenylyltransferase [Vibrio sp. S234-5]MBE3654636.1 molybdopterin-synthase adenylyltransferase MoeB [Vibrio navarrensis]MBE3658555.1 molybdopterin-synthase adenylyltransferase MoeB [Vibrio navarrensis]MBE3662939.1 molybdopterin-synthase adenylyltransferase MoeB [Vibrio navarrensis]MBE4605549.1 molybdopterin-synthase adenylyltransferase MoeB [Vibrio navarrensis]
MLSNDLFLRYQRQIALEEVGESGQLRLSEASVLLIGCGGLGCAAALYLAGAGVGRLVLVDDDTVDVSNLQRQVAFRSRDVASSKSDALRNQLNQLNSETHIRVLNQRISGTQLSMEVMMADVVLDCTDNFPSRQAISLACLQQRKPLISAAAIGWLGQFGVFDYTASDSATACYHCLYPFDEAEQSQRCSDLGVMGPVVGILGNYQALAAIQKLATGRFHLASNQLHLFDGLTMKWQTINTVRDARCAHCGNVA